MIKADQKYDFTDASYHLTGKVIATNSRYKRYGYKLDNHYFQWPYSHGLTIAPKVLSTWSK